MQRLRAVMDDPAVRRMDKLKVLMLYVITKGGIKEKELQQICEEFSLSSEERQTVYNLLYLGVTVTTVCGCFTILFYFTSNNNTNNNNNDDNDTNDQ